MLNRGHISTKSVGNDKSYTQVDPGPYVAIVKDNRDANRMGALTVNIPSLSKVAETNRDGLYVVQYLTPFYGAKSPQAVDGSEVAEYKGSQHSYGFWAVPPDIDSRVLVIFAEGNTKQGFWIGCIQDTYTNHMVPGIAASNDTQVPPEISEGAAGSNDKQTKYGTDNVPAGEANRKLYAEVSQQGIDRLKKPIHPFAETLNRQGLIADTVRGTTTSSARRESPSRVFGMSTPGPEDVDGKKNPLGPTDDKRQIPTTRGAGHTFVMDDGDANGDNQLVRLRTSSGHQLLLNDSADVIYIANGTGKAWMEFAGDGTIDVYSAGSINYRAGGDINFHSDANISMYAKNQFKVASLNKMVLDGGEIMQYAVADIKSHSNTGTITHKAPLGHILSYAGQSQINQAGGEHHITGSKVHFNSMNTRSDIIGDIVQTGIQDDNKLGTNTLAVAVPDVNIKQTTPLTVTQNGNVSMTGMRVPTHEPFPFHKDQVVSFVGGKPSLDDNVPGTAAYVANSNRNSSLATVRLGQYQADLQAHLVEQGVDKTTDIAKLRRISDAFTKTYNKIYGIPDSISAISGITTGVNEAVNQTIDSITGASVSLLKDQVFVNQSGVLYSAGNLGKAITGTTKGVIKDLSKGKSVTTTVGNALGNITGNVQGIVPGLGSVVGTATKVTDTYKNFVGGKVTAVTQVTSVVSKGRTKIASVAKSIGKVFGF